jgi:hypothetical protein
MRFITMGFSLSGFDFRSGVIQQSNRLKPMLLALPADSAVARVFENHTAARKFVANSI